MLHKLTPRPTFSKLVPGEGDLREANRHGVRTGDRHGIGNLESVRAFEHFRLMPALARLPFEIKTAKDQGRIRAGKELGIVPDRSLSAASR